MSLDVGHSPNSPGLGITDSISAAVWIQMEWSRLATIAVSVLVLLCCVFCGNISRWREEGWRLSGDDSEGKKKINAEYFFFANVKKEKKTTTFVCFCWSLEKVTSVSSKCCRGCGLCNCEQCFYAAQGRLCLLLCWQAGVLFISWRRVEGRRLGCDESVAGRRWWTKQTADTRWRCQLLSDQRSFRGTKERTN